MLPLARCLVPPWIQCLRGTCQGHPWDELNQWRCSHPLKVPPYEYGFVAHCNSVTVMYCFLFVVDVSDAQPVMRRSASNQSYGSDIGCVSRDDISFCTMPSSTMDADDGSLALHGLCSMSSWYVAHVLACVMWPSLNFGVTGLRYDGGT